MRTLAKMQAWSWKELNQVTESDVSISQLNGRSLRPITIASIERILGMTVGFGPLQTKPDNEARVWATFETAHAARVHIGIPRNAAQFLAKRTLGSSDPFPIGLTVPTLTQAELGALSFLAGSIAHEHGVYAAAVHQSKELLSSADAVFSMLEVEGRQLIGRCEIRAERDMLIAAAAPAEMNHVPGPMEMKIRSASLSLDQKTMRTLEEGDIIIDQACSELANDHAWLCFGGLECRISLQATSLTILDDARRSCDEVLVATESADHLDAALAEATVQLRLELGTIALPLSQVTSLKPGVIVETGTPISETIVLRVGGAKIAEGTLVEIDGRFGVKLTSLANKS